MITVYTPTNTLSPHEPAFMLIELRRWCQPEDQYHRWQTIWVNRNGVLTRFDEDLGPWSGFPLRVLGLWEESVAALKGIAERERLREVEEGQWQKDMEEQAQESDLISRAVFIAETNQQVIYNRSQYGPKGFKQRNGFSQAAKVLYERQRRRN